MLKYLLKACEQIQPLISEGLTDTQENSWKYEIKYFIEAIDSINNTINNGAKDYYGNRLSIGDWIKFGDSDDWDSDGKIIMFDEYEITALIDCGKNYVNSPYWMSCNSLKKS